MVIAWMISTQREKGEHRPQKHRAPVAKAPVKARPTKLGQRRTDQFECPG